MLFHHYLLLQSAIETGSILSRFIVAIGFLIAFISFACLLFFIVARQRQNKLFIQTKAIEQLERQLLQAQVEIHENTLNAISRELHDNVGQLLSSSKMLMRVASRNPERAEGALKNADELIGSAISAIRSLSKAFNKDYLRQFSLIENLQTEITRNNIHSDILIHFEHPGDLPLEADDQIILFRIIQEAIQNAIRHSGAKNIRINIFTNGDLIDISIADDGHGFEPNNKVQTGVGIVNINARVKTLGGDIVWQSNEHGTTIMIKLNLKHTEYAH